MFSDVSVLAWNLHLEIKKYISGYKVFVSNHTKNSKMESKAVIFKHLGLFELFRGVRFPCVGSPVDTTAK